MTPAERPQWNSLSLMKLQLSCHQAPVWQSSSLCLLLTHGLSCKHVLTPEISTRPTPRCVIKWSSDCHYRWWQLHLFMRAAGCSPATELQTSHMNHLLATIVSWRLNLRNDTGTKPYKNITHLAAELLWATLNFKYRLLYTISNNHGVITVRKLMQCSHLWVHFVVTVVHNMKSGAIFTCKLGSSFYLEIKSS